ncbi:hypothetical protein VT98_10662 [Candidatus Electrothrix communis]|uniref:Uncharacterized protein n=1 Tax=Candidatus Electrothrix communis TaxID=1859133 RepID=A0A3S3QW34_9BACT|nr:hypothetical protein VT98_10662 [Candidatus Electrothrix communis]
MSIPKITNRNNALVCLGIVYPGYCPWNIDGFVSCSVASSETECRNVLGVGMSNLDKPVPRKKLWWICENTSLCSTMELSDSLTNNPVDKKN